MIENKPTSIGPLYEALEKRAVIIRELGFHPENWSKLQEFLTLVWQANSELNLFSRQTTPQDLVDNHVVDCLLPLKLFPSEAQCIADFGSGGGFPGVIYALNFPDRSFQLFEKSPKKQLFLKRCQQLFTNIQVFSEIPSRLPGVDLVISRAFKPLDVIFELSRDYYQKGGQYFLLKGRMEKIQEEIALAHKKIKGLQLEVIPLQSPVLQVERHLVRRP